MHYTKHSWKILLVVIYSYSCLFPNVLGLTEIIGAFCLKISGAISLMIDRYWVGIFLMIVFFKKIKKKNQRNWSANANNNCQYCWARYKIYQFICSGL